MSTLNKSKPWTFRPKGLSDAIDGTSAFAGAMSLLQNLVPNPANADQWVPRPAGVQLTNFTGFTTPTVGSALLILGTKIWGMIASARFAGKDEPFCYDMIAGTFVTIANVTAANTPTSQGTTGDWVPPVMVSSTNGRITITHPGYNGSTTFVGWIDLSSFSSATITGNTNTNTTVNSLSTNVLLAGWTVGMRIVGTNIPANTFITAIAVGGTSITISQAATGSTAGSTFTVTGGTPAAPIYGAGNVNGNPFTTIPTCVGVFSSRTWYGVNNFVVYSDTLNPQQVTAATQALTLGDSTNVTALVGLPLSSQITGGSVQSLIAFKGAQTLFQITGDAATTNLALNAINGSVGTLAPNTICATTRGLAYVAPDGIRILGFNGAVGEPIGRAGQGVNTPFLNAVNPSRMAAAFNNNVMRVTCQAVYGSQVQVEYFYDFDRGVFSGPHTFPLSIVKPYYAGAADTCIGFAFGVDAKLWQVSVVPTPASLYTENGTALASTWQTTLLPDNGDVAGNAMVETNIAIQLAAGQQATILASVENGNVLDQLVISGPAGAGPIWGSFNWGAANWGLPGGAFRQQDIAWNIPLVFKQMQIRLTTMSVQGLVVGNLYLRYQTLGYNLPYET